MIKYPEDLRKENTTLCAAGKKGGICMKIYTYNNNKNFMIFASIRDLDF